MKLIDLSPEQREVAPLAEKVKRLAKSKKGATM
jgi:hypothetical protein